MKFWREIWRVRNRPLSSETRQVTRQSQGYKGSETKSVLSLMHTQTVITDKYLLWWQKRSSLAHHGWQYRSDASKGSGHDHWCVYWVLIPCRARLNIKTIFPGIGIPMLKIRWSRDHLIFNMRIPILVRWHLYTETSPEPQRVSKRYPNSRFTNYMETGQLC